MDYAEVQQAAQWLLDRPSPEQHRLALRFNDRTNDGDVLIISVAMALGWRPQETQGPYR